MSEIGDYKGGLFGDDSKPDDYAFGTVADTPFAVGEPGWPAVSVIGVDFAISVGVIGMGDPDDDKMDLAVTIEAAGLGSAQGLDKAGPIALRIMLPAKMLAGLVRDLTMLEADLVAINHSPAAFLDGFSAKLAENADADLMKLLGD